MKKVLKLLSIAVALMLLGKWYGACDTPEAAKRGAPHLVNRLWVDKVPQHDRDLVTQLVLVKTGSKREGVIGQASQWLYAYQRARYEVKGDTLYLELPQTGAKTKLTARSWKCKEAPKPLNLCLELKHGRRTMMFYSRALWSTESLDLDDLPETLRPTAAAALEAAQRPLPEGTCADCAEQPGERFLEALGAR